MKNMSSVQVIHEQSSISQAQGKKKTDEAQQSQSNPVHSAQPLFVSARYKTTHGHSLQPSFLPRLPVNEFPASPRVSCRLWHTIASEIQLIPPLRGTSETRLMARTRDDQCILSINELQVGCSQVMNIFPLCQTQDALLVPRGLELHGFPSSPFASVPSIAQLTDTTKHDSSLKQIKWLICFCTASLDFIYFFFPG